MAQRVQPNVRRTVIAALVATTLPAGFLRATYAAGEPRSGQQWYDAALRMRKLAESWGDQSYGAVLVLNGELVGEGPSRVVKKNDPDAHAEREAIRDAQARLGPSSLAGSVLYSTSRPCAVCEAAAANAGVSRMYFGPSLMDAGVPRQGSP